VIPDEALPRAVRVYGVVDRRKGRIYGMTCNVNQASAWTRALIEKYGDSLAAVQCVDLVDPDEQDIPWHAHAEETP
jgi:hypothetical protein